MTKSDDEFWCNFCSRPSGKKHSACPEIEDQFIWSWSNFASFIVMESQLQKFWYHWILFKKKSSLKSDLSYGFMELALPITLSICLPCLSTPQLVENWKLDQIDHPSRRFQYICSISIFLNNLRDILILKQSLCNNLLRGLPPAWPRLDLRFGMRARIGY